MLAEAILKLKQIERFRLLSLIVFKAGIALHTRSLRKLKTNRISYIWRDMGKNVIISMKQILFSKTALQQGD
jgi:hypothetical protein